MNATEINDAYHKWDKEFCTDKAPTYWECWQAACASMQLSVNVAYVEARYASAGLAGLALRIAPHDPHVESILQRIITIEEMLTPSAELRPLRTTNKQRNNRR